MVASNICDDRQQGLALLSCSTTPAQPAPVHPPVLVADSLMGTYWQLLQESEHCVKFAGDVVALKGSSSSHII